ncbi:MAG: hypothetical protein CFH21_00140 [Alphaproteobacteria bacterium MarineAlpha5_Bin11]|nr:MAG: hypothetical protein CFH21_00140 [Alphaproteobacteria bacterium MarineAlpha5_Bin11]PPR51852.1 MAG: hypothetical protein CFH20_00270 [Alphaproteobacteria bacterium MarineAlpha5_Bin10]|tara:strand:- start:5367 stop:5945 length:579 start_codon:yes stop_codon:yes gene_type:complete
MKLITKLNLAIIGVVFFQSCANIQPLYKESADVKEKINNIYIMPIDGRYGVKLKNELEEAFGGRQTNEGITRYTLKASVGLGSRSVQVYNVDGTANRFKSTVTIEYTLYDNEGCVILSKENKTDASYNSKSGGYDYGNIASEIAAVNRNIEYNVKHFYPQVFNAIKTGSKKIPFVAPYLAIADFDGCGLYTD